MWLWASYLTVFNLYIYLKNGAKVPTQTVAPSFIKCLLSLYLTAVLGAADTEWRARGTKSLPREAFILVFWRCSHVRAWSKTWDIVKHPGGVVITYLLFFVLILALTFSSDQILTLSTEMTFLLPVLKFDWILTLPLICFVLGKLNLFQSRFSHMWNEDHTLWNECKNNLCQGCSHRAWHRLRP